MVGESAGGGLCLATLLAIRDQGLPRPSAAVAMSPWTRSHGDWRVVPHEGGCFACHLIIWRPYAASIMPEYTTLTDPYISPLYGDLHGLPPLFISVGNDETMRDDAIVSPIKRKPPASRQF